VSLDEPQGFPEAAKTCASRSSYEGGDMPNSARIDIVVPNCDGTQLLRRHLPSVLACIAPELLTIVDDGSTDGSVDLFKTEFPEVRVIERKVNGGFSAAVNDGIRATDGEFVVLLNNDVEVPPGFLDPMLPLFGDESVFAVSPRIILPAKGNIDEGCKTGFWHHGMFYADQRQGANDVRPALYACGCAAVYRRSMLEQLGGFDEAYSPFYWEDADLGYRAWKRGWKSLYQPASTVYHQHSASISKLRGSYTGGIKSRNSLLFIWRNIEDAGLLSAHRRWLPLVLLRRAAAGDKPSLLGWRDAFARRSEAAAAAERDSKHRKLSDREIMHIVGVDCR
jgi:GT2 family glycosyltransferase